MTKLAIAVLLASLACFPGKSQPWPTQGWATSTTAAEKMNDIPLLRLDSQISKGLLGYVDHLLIIRNGRQAFERHYENDYKVISKGKEGAIGCGYQTCDSDSVLGEFNYYHPDLHPYYHGTTYHTLQSVSKSITSVLIGIAIKRGKIKNVHEPLLSFFDGYNLTKVDPRLRKATLEDLMTMRSGIEWHEMDRPSDDTNTTTQLEKSKDWIQFTLDQPMDASPGTKWVYNSGGSHLMSGIIKSATGEFADKYAEANLFKPLGITGYHWKLTPTLYPDTEGGVYLAPADLAKIGYLYLNKGVWEYTAIVDPEWVSNSVKRHVTTPNGSFGYGYQWWRPDTDGVEKWACMGYGENYLLVIPEYNIVAVINSWNIFDNKHQSVLRPLIKALLESVRSPR